MDTTYAAARQICYIRFYATLRIPPSLVMLHYIVDIASHTAAIPYEYCQNYVRDILRDATDLTSLSVLYYGHQGNLQDMCTDSITQH